MKRYLMLSFLLWGMLLAGVIDLDPSETVVRLVRDTRAGVSFDVSIDRVQAKPREAGGEQYDLITVPGWGHTTATGQPALPQTGRMIMIPRGSQVRLRIDTDAVHREGAYLPYPAQRPVTDTWGEEQSPFVVDPSSYRSGGQTGLSDFAHVSAPFRVRGMDFVWLRLHPVLWHPEDQTLEIAQRMTVSLEFDAGSVVDQRLRSPWFESMLSARIANPAMMPQTLERPLFREGADLIIVTAPELSAAAGLLAVQKRKLGFYTTVVTTNETGATADEITDYIQNGYDNWERPPSFVLLFGDSDMVPCHYVHDELGTSSTMGSDLPFGCMDGYGDTHPDIGLGRISVNDAAEGMLVVQKIIQYENNPPLDPGFYQNAAVCGYFQDRNTEGNQMDGYEDRRFVLTSEEIRDFLLSENYFVERIYCTESQVSPTHYNDGYYANGEPIPDELLRANGFLWDGNSYDITNAINSGVFIVNHRDHGISRNYTYDSGGTPSFDGWGDPHYDNGDINSLNNGNLLPFVFSFNCQTGWFDAETDHESNKMYESFCETFIRKENGGAVGAYGASRSSLSGYNDMLVHGIYDGMWPQMHPNYSFPGADGTVSLSLLSGLAYMEQYWDTDAWSTYEYYIFHTFADPTMRIWRQQPQPITVVHDSIMPFTVMDLSIQTDLPEGTASLTLNGELIGSAHFTQNPAVIYFDQSLSGTCTLTLTVSARDHQNYQDQIIMVQPTEGYLVSDGMIVSDPEGNGDGEWDAGETVQLHFTIRNAGLEATSADQVILTTQSELINLSEVLLDVPAMESGESVQCEVEGFISSLAPHLEEIVIDVQIDNPIGLYSSSHSLIVTRLPKLRVLTESIDVEGASGAFPGLFDIEVENTGGASCDLLMHDESNRSLDISEVAGYLMIDDHPLLHGLEEFTLSVWMKNESSNNICFAINKGTTVSNCTFIIGQQNQNSLFLRYTDAGSTAARMDLPLPQPISYWTHLAVVFSEDTVRGYINGLEVVESAYSPPLLDTNQPLIIGGSNAGIFEFNGWMDDFRMYQRALSADEIAWTMGNRIRGVEEGMIAGLGFDPDSFYSDVTGNLMVTPMGDIGEDSFGAPSAGWLDFPEQEVTISAHSSQTLQVRIDPSGYETGQYTTNVLLEMDSAADSIFAVPVTLNWVLFSDEPELPPNRMALFPNPFRPGTQNAHIHFSIPESQDVSVGIYNIRGQLVRTVAHQRLEAGSHLLGWNGRDESGHLVSSGVYLCRIRTEEHSVVKKMMILR